MNNSFSRETLHLPKCQKIFDQAKKSPQSVRAEIQTLGGVGGDRSDYIAAQQINQTLFLHITHSQIEYQIRVFNSTWKFILSPFPAFSSAILKKTKKARYLNGAG
ncbi:hypothetical protein [Undibacterium sp. Xuan67W]|uniref:hypothetical protein n=1 Tax=Undibacterium sp. Xuan67W TaxID=3413057 RepID=UPI003BF32265